MNHLKLWRRLLAALLLGLAAPWLGAIQLVPMTSTALSSPVFVGNAGDGTRRLFIVEQSGIIKVLQPGSTVPTTFLDIHTRLFAGGERGLLELAIHPQYPSNGRFFVYDTRSGDGALVGVCCHVAHPTPRQVATKFVVEPTGRSIC